MTWLLVVSSHTRTHAHAPTHTHTNTHIRTHAHMFVAYKQRRPVQCLRTYTCVLRKQGMHAVMLLWLFRLHVQISFSIIQPSCFACSALANSRACDLTCFAAGRSLWSGLWCSFSKWRVGTRFVLVPVCGVCQWCLVLQTCVLQMVGVLEDLRGLGHMSSHSHTHTGVGGAALRREPVVSDCAHTHVCCRSKESVVTVPLPGSLSDCSSYLVMFVQL